MRVFVTGATGFVGRALVPRLQRERHSVVAWVRSIARARGRLGAEVELVDAGSGRAALIAALEECEAVVNCAGEPIMRARRIRGRGLSPWSSRVDATERLVQALASARRSPRVLVSSSAVGYYGDRAGEMLHERASPGADVLARLCARWEAAALEAASLGVRVVVLRAGLVLGRDGGALASMRPVFRLGLGGRVGSGRQYVPWIHLHDLVTVVAEALADERFRGPINAAAPEPVTNRDLAMALGRALRRPAILPVPAAAARAVLGDAASALLASQRVDPAALRALGFTFAFPTLAAALADVVGGSTVAVGRVAEPVDPQGDAASREYLARRRPTYELRTRTTVAAPVDEAFAFFSRAENLGMLTPAAMRFSISGRAPAIDENATIEYRLRVGPVPIAWRSRIVSWRAGSRFIDLQERGPYRSWWHEHSFQSLGSSTVMEDRVCYSPPLGPLGRLANRVFIVPTLRRIFQYRADVIRLRFGEATSRG